MVILSYSRYQFAEVAVMWFGNRSVSKLYFVVLYMYLIMENTQSGKSFRYLKKSAFGVGDLR